VYNADSPEGFNPDLDSPWESSMYPDTSQGRIDLTLGSSEIFVSGDNRPASADSRFNGPLNVSHIIGPVL
jgi:type IV secretory pathway protease TraF